VRRFAAFGFYLPVILVLTGVSGIGATNFVTGAISHYRDDQWFRRAGDHAADRASWHCRWGFGIAFVSLVAARSFYNMGWKGAVRWRSSATHMSGPHWDATRHPSTHV